MMTFRGYWLSYPIHQQLQMQLKSYIPILMRRHKIQKVMTKHLHCMLTQVQIGLFKALQPPFMMRETLKCNQQQSKAWGVVDGQPETEHRHSEYHSQRGVYTQVTQRSYEPTGLGSFRGGHLYRDVCHDKQAGVRHSHTERSATRAQDFIEQDALEHKEGC
jgi:hypothetical protein